MNVSLGSALDAIRRDLRNTGGIELRISEEPATTDPWYESVLLLSGRRSSTGVLAPVEMADAERLVHVADQVQEFVFEELARLELPATWPECPEHPASHPLTPVLAPGGPCWQCPKSGDAVSRIGELAS
ncbi:hypothetical protein [Streptomyces sp. SID13031]|uniref:hypothetical protein n=1 Tax=Streptomyces sp. SID13031 TaxID=2706046 RepID=UPI0013C9646A|nr:hypothetical protein [Streptomyces sp. SID13031]NEA34297.1 hypothetical protein [Streptomyces sp. SID13031]